MVSARLILLFTLLGPVVNARAYGSGSRGDDAFPYVQPLNTTILTQYGSSPPVYPAPNITGIGGWSDAMERTKAFVAELTLDEKADMVTGTPGPCNSNIVAIPRLGFPDLYFQDGPLAVRIAYYAPAFPAGVAAAAS